MIKTMPFVTQILQNALQHYKGILTESAGCNNG